MVELGFGLSDIFIPSVSSFQNCLSKDSTFRAFCEEVYATLHSQIQGFTDLCDLMRCYHFDTGKDPLEMAQKFGFNSFNAFLNSDEMKKFVIINYNGNNEVIYHATERDQFNHIRKEQLESFHNSCLKRARREGYCDFKRIRPKIFEVAKIGDFCDNDLIESKIPDVLKRPVFKTNFQNQYFSIWQDEENTNQDLSIFEDVNLDEWASKNASNICNQTNICNEKKYKINWGEEITKKCVKSN